MALREFHYGFGGWIGNTVLAADEALAEKCGVRVAKGTSVVVARTCEKTKHVKQNSARLSFVNDNVTDKNVGYQGDSP